MPALTRRRTRARTSIYEPTFIGPRRRSNGVSKTRYEKAEVSRKRAIKRARDMKEKFGTQAPLYAAGGFVLGAATAGAMGAAMDTTWGGFDVRLLVAAGLVAGAVVLIDDPMMSIFVASAGLGIGAPAIATTVDEALSGAFAAAKAS